jgi:hypothetical protein
MRNRLSKKFDEICASAEKYNKENRTDRFLRMFDQSKKFVSMGLYDSVTKKYVVFDTINLTGNFRYSNNVLPNEFIEMENMIKRA